MKKITKYLLFCLIGFSLLLGACSNSTQNTASGAVKKSDFPKKPIELIVPLGPGSTTDTIARVLANGVTKYLPKEATVVVVNKPGGGGIIGTTDVFNAKPDGYTIGLVQSAALTLQPHYGQATYTHDSFTPIMKVTSDPTLLLVRNDSPLKTYDDWLEYVKQNPGKFIFAITGKGGNGHVAVEAINKEKGVKTNILSTDAAAEMVNALLGGHTDGAIVPYITSKPQLDAGKVRALVNVGATKNDDVNDIPLLPEIGIDKTFDSFFGIVAPKGLPEEEQNILHDAFKKTLEDPEVIGQLKKTFIEPNYEGPEDFQKTITKNYKMNEKILKEIGMIK
ncbi:tripartite tricarboxylate transporter substrate binding protein [Niallia oryzisoli]|uniref:Tripartite tricarboxylate transporter substrate binding protein n=1 Tax=Niallia oryzisoli TaxID=1737571 RepID=A0ABZ2CA36_9BACI